METERDRHIRELAELYRRHFAATRYREGAELLEEAEAYQHRLVEEFGEEYARAVDHAAYRIGHG